MKKEKKARIGVIGLGMGRSHLRNYKNCERAEVVAICDKNELLLKATAKEYEIPYTFTDIDEMLSSSLDLRVLSIALPNYLHYPITVKALERGINVLCEKPMAMNSVEAEKMVHCAEDNNRKLMINHSYRFIGHCQAIKDAVDKGIIGEIYCCRTIWHRRGGIPKLGGWFGIKSLSGGGSLIDIGVHRLDLALWFMGYPHAVSVSASTYGYIGRRLAAEAGVKFDVEDISVAFIRLDNGSSMIFETSWDGYFERREDMITQILGTKGGVIQRNLGEGYNFEARLFNEENGVLFENRILSVSKKKLNNAMEHFVECVLDDKTPMISGEQGLECMKIIDAIYSSAKTGKEVVVGP